MTMPAYALPFGLREVWLIPDGPDGQPDTDAAVKLPASRTFSFSETEDFEELAGDDRTIASHGSGPTVDWDLEGGGVSLEVVRVLVGGTVAETGTSPEAVRRFVKKTSHSRPYFSVVGRAISDNGGDFVGCVRRCKADGDFELEFANGSFMLTSCSGKGYGDLDNEDLFWFEQRESAAAIDPATILNPLDVAPVITTTDLDEMTQNAAFSQQLAATGSPTPTWAVTAGTLPDGLTLSTGGLLSGTPTVDGAYDFTVTATNTAGTDTMQYTGTIATA